MMISKEDLKAFETLSHELDFTDTMTTYWQERIMALRNYKGFLASEKMKRTKARKKEEREKQKEKPQTK